MGGFASGALLGAAVFLIVDMGFVHQLSRFHGVLFSDLFEYSMLIIGAALASRTILRSRKLLGCWPMRDGLLWGVGITLFLDVAVVDQILRLHAVNYLEIINVGSGMIGAVLAAAGILHMLTVASSQHESSKQAQVNENSI